MHTFQSVSQKPISAPRMASRDQLALQPEEKTYFSADSVRASLAKAKWDAKAVTFAIAAKNEKRSEKGVVVPCFVLERKDSADGMDELPIFLEKLKQNIHNGQIEEKTRFQLAIQIGTHWTACDVMIEHGMPKIFILDAVNQDETLKSLDRAFNAIFPATKMFVYVPDTIFNEQKPDELKTRRMQFGEGTCSHFTLDHLFHLSKIDLFKELELESGNLQTDYAKKFNPSFFRMDANNCPEKLAFIFRNTQSWEVLDSLRSDLKDRVINHKGQTLIQSAGSHSIEVEKENPDGTKQIKIQNRSIEYKRDGFFADTEKFMSRHTEEELEEIFRNRNGFRFLEDREYREELQNSAKKKLKLSKKTAFALSNAVQTAKNSAFFKRFI